MKLVEEEEARQQELEEKIKLERQLEDEHAQTVQGRRGARGGSGSRSRSRSSSPSAANIENETF